MKKTILLLVMTTLLFGLISSVSAVSEPGSTTVIAGKIYNADYTMEIGEAEVTVTCSGFTSPLIYSNSDGSYSASFDRSVCSEGDYLSVHAYKEGVGENTVEGDIHNQFPTVDLNLGVVNVPLVPEFGTLAAGLTVFAALGAFFLVRRR
jgi:hypothetical protein